MRITDILNCIYIGNCQHFKSTLIFLIYDLIDRRKENQDKHLWQVSLISKKNTKKREIFRKIPCQYDLGRMSLKNVSESVISDKNHPSKNSHEVNPCGKLLPDNNQGSTHTGKKSDEHNQDGEKDLIGQQKIEPLGPPLEDHECRAAVSEAATITPQRAPKEGKFQDPKEQGGNISNQSALKVRHKAPTRKNHFEVHECEKSTLFKHEKINMEEKTHESNENGNNFRPKTHLAQLHKTPTGKKTFECHHGNNSFYQESHLTQHEKTHTEEELYDSNKCGKNFHKS